ncbi:hypothetical protein ILYODFUR_037720 [Ilyodon furcidens]|uniref:Uncharacterized protein n=1 Tax=Ilyodon furcidens TaxID=33524 RepID=A0ABV0VCT1_9TELE
MNGRLIGEDLNILIQENIFSSKNDFHHIRQISIPPTPRIQQILLFQIFFVYQSSCHGNIGLVISEILSGPTGGPFGVQPEPNRSYSVSVVSSMTRTGSGLAELAVV